MLKRLKVWSKEEMEVDYRYFEVLFFLIAIISVGVINNIKTPMTNPDYVPSAMTGLTTVSGILTAFAGFWLLNEGKPLDELTRRVQVWRTAIIITVLLFSLFLIVSGLVCLVYGSIESAFRISVCGSVFIMLVALDILAYRYFNLGHQCKEVTQTSKAD